MNISRSSAKDLGRLLNADYLLIGAITDYAYFAEKKKLIYMFEWLQVTYTVGVTARLIDVKTGEVLWVGSASEESYSFIEAGEEAVRMLYKTITVK